MDICNRGQGFFWGLKLLSPHHCLVIRHYGITNKTGA
jgi:hypothetical protein